MITEEVIREIYKKYKKPVKNFDSLDLPHVLDVLRPFHDIRLEDGEIVVGSVEEFSPFKRFLQRSLYGVIEFEKYYAFVFKSHILFFSMVDSQLSVNFKPEAKRGFFDRLFGGDDDDE